MILLRRELGDVLREERQTQGRTLREVSAAASVSLGYLSEVERGELRIGSEPAERCGDHVRRTRSRRPWGGS